MESLPLGLNLPAIISATQRPPRSPPLNISIKASEFSAISPRQSGLPFTRTVITGLPVSFSFLIKAGDYQPEHVLYLSHNGRIIATATAVESPTYPGVGWFRMIGVHQDARGIGAGKTVCLAALHALRDRGYTEAMLSTDDERLPAISLYLSLGFEPYYSHESHKERWEKVLKALLFTIPPAPAPGRVH